MSALEQEWTVERVLSHVGLGVKRETFSICLPDGENFAEVFDREDAGEIANVIAAAPDMLEALDDAQAIARQVPTTLEGALALLTEIQERTARPIAKARGKS